MPWTADHLQWLRDTGDVIVTTCGKSAPVFEFRYDMTNDGILSRWARHFRNHYCLDTDLPHLKSPEQTNAEYLLSIKFPHASRKPGPSIRAGDFAEILVADYLQFLREYYVPRTRYDRKIIGNESSKGSDVIAFKQIGANPQNDDELLIFEVKSGLSENSSRNVLQTAITDSSKDEVRLAESLNGIKQRLFDKRDTAGVAVIDRFQRNIDAPYQRKFGASAVLTNTSYNSETLSASDSTNHIANADLELLVIRGESLMSLVHALYERAANEA
jgi:hypothetical protein